MQMLKLTILLCLIGTTLSGPVAAGSAVSLCYTACNAAWVACLSGSGIVAGTAGPVGWWAWATSATTTCSASQGACMSACVAAGLAATVAPTP